VLSGSTCSIDYQREDYRRKEQSPVPPLGKERIYSAARFALSILLKEVKVNMKRCKVN
jgi:hypothetical protein